MNRQEAAVIARAAKANATPPVEARFWSKVDRRGPNECWPWMASVRRKDEGYGAFWLDQRHQPSNRVAWTLTNGDIPEGMVVCHKCDNPPCCNPAHFFIGTRAENDEDRIAKGRQCRGERQKYAVLNDTLVRELRMLASEIGINKAARHLGINASTAWSAVRRSWRHV
jgi:hypothetical protein